MACETVQVIVRCRPFNRREVESKANLVLFNDMVSNRCDIINPANETDTPKSFTFDGVYSTDSTTEEIYNDIAFPLVECAIEGYNGTIFVYGQTGCGKSFTMQGVSAPADQRGIIPRAFEHIFEAIDTSESTKFLVYVSYLEIYNEEVKDLIGEDTKKSLDIKEHHELGIYVSGLSMHPVNNVQECEQLMDKGCNKRSVGSTLMNSTSSRSHAIFTIYLERMDTEDQEMTIKKGKLNLVDLAGSERQSRTGTTGKQLKEATKINMSLSALGNVISALVDGKSSHIPYRYSKLTRLLQDSLGGNTKTLMIGCLSPAGTEYDETLSTLRYANRAKNIKNKPVVNGDPGDALLRQYQEEIQTLEATIAGQCPVENVRLILKDDSPLGFIKSEHEKRIEQIICENEAKQIPGKDHSERRENIEKVEKTVDESLENLEEDEGQSKSISSSEEEKVDESQEKQRGTPSFSVIDKWRAVARLKALQMLMVGGSKAHDQRLKERRAERQIVAKSNRSLDTTVNYVAAAYLITAFCYYCRD